MKGIVLKELVGGWYEIVLLLDDEEVDLKELIKKAEQGEYTKITARLAGKLRKNNIKIVMGDKVEVELNTTDPTKGLIRKRWASKKR